jgi:hypothetical protein
LDFRRDVGDIADVLSFGREFLNRQATPEQSRVLVDVCGAKAHEWSVAHHEFVMKVGMKGGKNFIAEWIADYYAYKFKTLADPHSFFTKITGRSIPYTLEKNFDIVNVSSVDEVQARRVFFETIKNIFRLTKDPRTGDNWFQRYANLNLNEGGFGGDLHSKIIQFPTDTPGKGTMRFMSFCTAASAPEGLHILLFMADELSRADTKAKYMEAEKLYDLGLMNTTASFPNKVGKVMSWSYVNDTDYDLTEQRYQLSLTNPDIKGYWYSTFQFNPTLTKEMLAAQYRADPRKARRVYECIKPVSKENFYQPHVEKLDDIINPTIHNRIKFKPIVVTRKAQGKIYKYSSIEILSIAGDTRERCFAYDLSKNKDRLIIVGGYNDTINPLMLEMFLDEETEYVTTNKRAIIDVFIAIEPSAEYPIDFFGLGSIFTSLHKAFPRMRKCNSDHYQNEKLSAEMIARGVQAETYFFSNEMQTRLYTVKRTHIWANNFQMASDDHEMHVGNDIMSISQLYVHEGKQLVQDGKRIDHPANGGSKDVQDSVAICHHDLLSLETEGKIVASGVDGLPESKLIELAERYMIERQVLRNKHIDPKQHLPLIAAVLGLKPNETMKIREYVEDRFPNT